MNKYINKEIFLRILYLIVLLVGTSWLIFDFNFEPVIVTITGVITLWHSYDNQNINRKEIIVGIIIFFIIISVVLIYKLFFYKSSIDETKTFELKIKRAYNKKLEKVVFYDDENCEKKELIPEILANGNYQLSLKSEKGTVKKIYIKSKLIRCGLLKFNKNYSEFKCHKDCNNSREGACAYKNIRDAPTCTLL